MELKEGIPLHKQISDWLKENIEAGKLEQNEKLPSENELSDKFDVSRVTVRRALQTLENEQLIYRCQGLGSFVSDQRTHQAFSYLSDFTEELEGSGMKASAKVISVEQRDIENRNDLLSYLDIQNKKIAVRIERVRLGDDKPIAYDITWLPVFYAQLIDGFDLESQTIFKILENEFDIPVEKGCYRIEAAIADKNRAKHLDVEEQTPLLLMNRIAYTIADKPIFFQKRFYRNDRIVFELMMKRRSNTAGGMNKVETREFSPVFTEES